jgi:hypothetical protein
MIINIPFEGFYESKHSSELDSIEERYVEWEVERDPTLDTQELGDLIYRTANYSLAFDHIARASYRTALRCSIVALAKSIPDTRNRICSRR